MTQAVVERKVCEKCGAEAREGTAFCYNCGSPVSTIEPEKPVAETPPNGSESRSDKRSRAASERKKARIVGQRKAVEYTWEPTSDTASTLIASIVLFVIVIFAIVLLVVWK